MAYLVIFIFIVIIVIQTPGLLKKKLYGELAVFLAIMIVALFYSIVGVTELNFPGPSNLVEFIFRPVSRIIFTNQQG